MSYVIFTDSCCNLPGDVIDSFDLRILSMTFMDEDGNQYLSYEKGVNKEGELKDFYDKMRAGTVFTTSLPKLDMTREAMEADLKAGNDILYLGFSSGLSSTYDSTEILMGELREEFPERTLISVDTLAASMGQGLLVYNACVLKEDGAGIEEVAQWVEDHKQHCAHWFTVSDLVYLFRGGRVSRSSAWAGNLLNIKPVLHVDDEGHLIPMDKVRGRKKSIHGLFSHMEKTFVGPEGKAKTIMIAHADCQEDEEALEKLIKERWPEVEIIRYFIDPVVGAHSGPGTLALFYLATSKN